MQDDEAQHPFCVSDKLKTLQCRVDRQNCQQKQIVRAGSRYKLSDLFPLLRRYVFYPLLNTDLTISIRQFFLGSCLYNMSFQVSLLFIRLKPGPVLHCSVLWHSAFSFLPFLSPFVCRKYFCIMIIRKSFCYRIFISHLILIHTAERCLSTYFNTILTL